MSNLLEQKLSAQLAPVDAPDDLWFRIQTGRKIPARRPVPVALAVAAVLLGAVWLTATPARPPQTVRVQPAGSCALCHL